MGFSLKEFMKKTADTVAIEFKKISPANEIRDAANRAVDRFESGIQSASAQARQEAGSWWDRLVGTVKKIPDTVDNVNSTANSARTMMWIAGGAAVLLTVYLLARKR